jgi:predicted enzyme related to lactoylglutathione lyase
VCMAIINRLGAIGIDCADPRTLASFYEKVTGWKVASSSDNFVALTGGPMWLTFHRIADYRRPSWPTQQVPKQVHLDFGVDDLDEAQSEAVQAGATVADSQPRPQDWRVLLDPEGHPFCLCAAVPSQT